MRSYVILVVVVISGVLAGCSHLAIDTQSSTDTSDQQTGTTAQQRGPDRVCIEKRCFVVEVADTQSERAQGLMGREQLADDAGMLFIFDGMRPFRSFWMKNTRIPLDMIRLDHQRRIVDITHNAPPCDADPCPTYTPGVKETKYVLEIPGGVSKEVGITTGMQATFQ